MVSNFNILLNSYEKLIKFLFLKFVNFRILFKQFKKIPAPGCADGKLVSRDYSIIAETMDESEDVRLRKTKQPRLSSCSKRDSTPPESPHTPTIESSLRLWFRSLSPRFFLHLKTTVVLSTRGDNTNTARATSRASFRRFHDHLRNSTPILIDRYNHTAVLSRVHPSRLYGHAC